MEVNGLFESFVNLTEDLEHWFGLCWIDFIEFSLSSQFAVFCEQLIVVGHGNSSSNCKESNSKSEEDAAGNDDPNDGNASPDLVTWANFGGASSCHNGENHGSQSERCECDSDSLEWADTNILNLLFIMAIVEFTIASQLGENPLLRNIKEFVFAKAAETKADYEK
jgi:hypothetical protein